MQKQIGVLNNLRAGQNKRGVSSLLSYLTSHSDVLHIETEDSADVPEALSQFASREVGVLVVNGGDGTLQQTLTTILNDGPFDEPPLIAPLRGGRTNMSAIDMGSQHDSVKALASLVASLRAGEIETRRVDRAVLKVTIPSSLPVQYGLFCGAGVIHRAVDLVHRAFPPGRHARGALGAGLLTSILVARAAMRSTTGLLTPDRMSIRVDGERIVHEEFQLVISTTLERLFLRMQPFWGRERKPVRLTAIARSPHRAFRSAPGIFRGRPGPNVTPANGYTSRNANCVELEPDCGICIDGELYPPEKDRCVRIEADRRIRFVRA